MPAMNEHPIDPPKGFNEAITKILGDNWKLIVKNNQREGLAKVSPNFCFLYEKTGRVVEEADGQEDRHYPTIASFVMQQLPGCCGICLSYHAIVGHTYRKKGLGTLLQQMRIQYAKELGFGLFMCTDFATNKGQRNILKKNGLKDVELFVNPRTNNPVHISTIHLLSNDTEKRAFTNWGLEPLSR